MASNILNELGYETMSAVDGEEGLEIFRKNQDSITLILLDLVMPRMDGEETLRKLLEINSKVKVILSSGFSGESRVEDLLNNGAAGFIQKPYRSSDLSKTIADALK
jgi:CheY-like chemotaxis protein